MPDIDINTDRLLIGQGFNTITGEQGGMAVVFNGPQDLTTAGGGPGQDVTLTLEQVTSLEQMKNRLDLSAAASFGFGIFNSDVAVEFIQNGSFTRFNSFLYVDVIVTNPTEVLRRLTLTRPALERAARGSSAFLDFCGNSYVFGRQTGGQLSAIVQVTSTTTEDFQRVRTEVEASVASFGSGQVTIDRALERLVNVSQTRIILLRRGGIGNIPSLQELIEATRQFPSLVASQTGNPVIVKLLTRGYNTVDNLPSGVIDLAILDQQARTLEIIASFLDRAHDVRGDLKFMSQNPNLFIFTGDFQAAVEEAFEQNEAIIRSLRDSALEVRRNPTAPVPSLPTFPTVNATRVSNTPPPSPPPPALPPVVVLFEGENFLGRSFTTNNSVPNLADFNFNDLTSSLAVNGRPGEYLVEFFRDSNFRDILFTIQSPFEIRSFTGLFRFGGSNNSLSSIRISKRT